MMTHPQSDNEDRLAARCNRHRSLFRNVSDAAYIEAYFEFAKFSLIPSYTTPAFTDRNAERAIDTFQSMLAASATTKACPQPRIFASEPPRAFDIVPPVKVFDETPLERLPIAPVDQMKGPLDDICLEAQLEIEKHDTLLGLVQNQDYLPYCATTRAVAFALAEILISG